MKEFVKFPSIEQFRNTVKQVRYIAQHEGYDEEAGQPIINKNAVMPVIEFRGTVKLHGTNAGVCLNTETGEVYAQSRKNIITPEKDNAGFAFFVESNKETFKEILQLYADFTESPKLVTIFGEWCGGNIQKGVALCELEKMFIIFACKVDDEWVDIGEIILPGFRIYHINAFPTYSITVDFNNPEASVNEMVRITEEVEAECPVGKAFGVSGVGEGVVWKATYEDNHLMFEVKGEKHSSSKVKKLASVDVEKLESIEKFVDYAVTENRLNQAVEQVFTVEDIEPNIRKMGDFLKWVMRDIVKEETDTLVESKLEPKDVSKSVNNKAKVWFINYLDEDIKQ